MIQYKNKPPAPAVLSRPKINAALVHLETQLANNGTLTSGDFKKRNYWTEVKKVLSNFQHGKCCFCERERDTNRESDVEHFRPKLALDNLPAPGHNGYWWLAYDWSNLLFVCSECNSNHKKNFFPLTNEAPRALSKANDIKLEEPCLLHPVDDNPELYIIYDYRNRKVPVPVGSANDHLGRGKKTIEVLGLDKRTELITGRSEKLNDMEICAKLINHMELSEKDFGEQLQNCIRSLKSHTNPKSNYAGFARFYFNQVGLGQHIDIH